MWLLVARALQGIGAAAGVATSRAVVRDQYTGQASARIMNLIGLIFAIGPAVSPSGALLFRTLGWHAIFTSMVLYGLVVVMVTIFAISETNPSINPAAARPRTSCRVTRRSPATGAFLRFSLIMSCAFGGLYTLPALLPFVLIGMVGLTPSQYGLATLIQTASYATGNLVTMQLLRRYEAVRLVPFGMAIIVVAAIIMAVGLRLFPPSLRPLSARRRSGDSAPPGLCPARRPARSPTPGVGPARLALSWVSCRSAAAWPVR